ncbi:MAG: class I SAM-dependent methyltransferase [Bacteriovoracaceae bacterium]
MSSFEKDYWEQNYSQPFTMDCIGNAKEHVKYMKAFFELEKVDISSVADFGFGYGYLFQKTLKAFLPYKALGVEPSRHAYLKAQKRKLKPVESTRLKLVNDTLESWCRQKDHQKHNYDLGICSSVFQYLEEEALEFVVKKLSKRIKYLYLTVPTDKELERQVEELSFDDKFALRRSSDFYKNILGKGFTNISSRIWESKFHFNEDTTLFTDLLYRH